MHTGALAEWNRNWAGVEADIWITLGIEPVAADKDQVIMKMPFKPEIGQATGLSCGGARSARRCGGHVALLASPPRLGRARRHLSVCDSAQRQPSGEH